MKKLLVILLLLCSTTLRAQEDDGTQLPFKLGVKTAMNFSLFSGTELQNPVPRFGYSAGIYLRNDLSSQWQLQTELLGNFKGSRFNNGEGEYNGISIFSIDLPVLLAYRLTDEHSLLIGPQFSHLAFSAMFTDNNAKPAKNKLNIQAWAIDAAVAYQMQGPTVGLQLAFKYGITDINKGLYFENITPVTGNNGSIHQLSMEFALLF